MTFHGLDKVRKFFLENPKRVFIMRGLPGSGKSTIIREIESWKDSLNQVEVCSSDHYFMVDDEYRFDPKLLPVNHAKCFRNYIEAVQRLYSFPPGGSVLDTVIVDNTNTVSMDLVPYCRVAEAFNVPFLIIEFLVDPSVSFQRNIHKVPIEVIFGMYKNLITDSIPGYYKRVLIQPESVIEERARTAWERPVVGSSISGEWIPEGRDKSGVIDP